MTKRQPITHHLFTIAANDFDRIEKRALEFVARLQVSLGVPDVPRPLDSSQSAIQDEAHDD